MKVKKIKRITLPSPVPVYDVTVPVHENFCLGNGIVVHNSKDMADGLAGAHWNASAAEQIYSNRHIVKTSLSDDPDKPTSKLEQQLRDSLGSRPGNTGLLKTKF